MSHPSVTVTVKVQPKRHKKQVFPCTGHPGIFMYMYAVPVQHPTPDVYSSIFFAHTRCKHPSCLSCLKMMTSEAVFIPEHADGSVKFDQVVQRLLQFGVPLVDAPLHVLESVERAHPLRPDVLNPAWLRRFLRATAQGSTNFALGNTNGEHPLFKKMDAEDVANFLEFVLSDGDLCDLEGVPLLICDDEDQERDRERTQQTA